MIPKSNRPSLIIKRIEEEKESRLKNIYLFTLSLNAEQEKTFNRGLKKLINDIGVSLEQPPTISPKG